MSAIDDIDAHSSQLQEVHAGSVPAKYAETMLRDLYNAQKTLRTATDAPSLKKRRAALVALAGTITALVNAQDASA